ncbi:MAG: ABC transporter ATP-binding protein [Deltaproteobacteria bacterium]|nr:ABC transporter ATP-binding protein [Deltaproteobacteria bacterium]MBW1934356.1 ABC transporter ATP-binding protein [Deltaproteobacteria bacterium]MBW1978466.1 ABC transporter ATP-binding protein [Deltaproteobacteria bacterium]MBW2043460.1 ABC transporter ATP-binding protein [Deltaproteobacteria bacterium]MBW2299420.1 ABC transporter ATP-binding protein [Deltaproteobacteria bacterium]
MRILELIDVDVFYGKIQALEDIQVHIEEKELVCLLGGNASGKSTTLKTILGVVKPARGRVEFMGDKISGLPTGKIVQRGVSIVPENRRIFPRLTVLENLELGAYLRNDPRGISQDMERVFNLFPRIKERLKQYGATLSGGEQQMLAMGRALMSRPKLLLMDEPSMGLAPVLVENSFEIIQRVNREGVTIFVVEQNANMALSIADRGYVLQLGKIVLHDKAENLLNNEMMKKAYLATG